MNDKLFQEHVAAIAEAERKTRDAIIIWAKNHAPDAKIRDLVGLLDTVGSVIGSGMTRSNSLGYQQGKASGSTSASQ